MGRVSAAERVSNRRITWRSCAGSIRKGNLVGPHSKALALVERNYKQCRSRLGFACCAISVVNAMIATPGHPLLQWTGAFTMVDRRFHVESIVVIRAMSFVDSQQEDLSFRCGSAS